MGFLVLFFIIRNENQFIASGDAEDIGSDKVSDYSRQYGVRVPFESLFDRNNCLSECCKSRILGVDLG